ncbi:DUF7192 family protein [Jiella mangrovi]|uniref:DUF7192 domain-containing protein n=1 Tax=Jiella mangrovi TaxID=2821407 RepID=A0ABS4BM58_9HYPH|nr:hypothetical protein [Jiella mangrovi]MBP0617817.1 hypothetical protein [Jiella mangrovi]
MARSRSEARGDDKEEKTINLRGNEKNLPTIRKIFRHVDDFIDMANNGEVVWNNSELMSRMVSVERSIDTLTDSWQQALELAINGWPEGAQLITKTLQKRPMSQIDTPKSQGYDVAGFLPDVGRFLSGEPLCMLSDVNSAPKGKVVVNYSVSILVSADDNMQIISNFGAALISRIQFLEENGYRVALNWISMSNPYYVFQSQVDSGLLGPKVLIVFPLKSIDEPIKINRLAFWLMHPAAQRRIQFAIKERMNIEMWYQNKYGSPEIRIEEIKKECAENEIIIVINSECQSVEDAMKEILNQEKAQWKASEKRPLSR